MNGHVPPSAAGGGEHHVAASALKHPRLVVRGQVSVEAAAAEDRTEFGLGQVTSVESANVKLVSENHLDFDLHLIIV